jgi:predicted nucleic acid-binding protein
VAAVEAGFSRRQRAGSSGGPRAMPWTTLWPAVAMRWRGQDPSNLPTLSDGSGAHAMPTTDVVSDASVALKWFHDEGEEEVASARALLDHHRRRAIALFVLDLTAYEVGNALMRGRLAVNAERVAVVLHALAQICPRLTLSSDDLAESARLAELHDLTLYDAAYATAAHVRGGQLATLDRALLRSGLGRRPSAIVADLGPWP